MRIPSGDNAEMKRIFPLGTPYCVIKSTFGIKYLIDYIRMDKLEDTVSAKQRMLEYKARGKVT